MAYERIVPSTEGDQENLAAMMNRLLGWKQSVHEDQRCLSCHAGWRKDREKPPRFEMVKRFGVSCESCHGPGSRWKDPHSRTDWRRLAAEQKEADYHMVDVRDPVQRAKQCLSCHIGNVPQGKVVTHEMYAAGHPRLPGIELMSFADRTPPHWRNLREKGEFLFKKEFLAANLSSALAGGEDLPRSRTVALGAIVALRESVQLVADIAAEALATAAENALAAVGDDDARLRWPELGVYDCAACHHDLKRRSPRQVRGYRASRPGRVPLPEWPQPMVRIVLRHAVAGDDQEFAEADARLDEELDALRRALSSQPFGEPAQVLAAAESLVEWLDSVSEDVGKRPFDEQVARRIVTELVARQHAKYLDYHGARQITWALETMLVELWTPYPVFPKPTADEDTVERQRRANQDFAELERWRSEDRGPMRAGVRRRLAPLNQLLELELPSGKRYESGAAQEKSSRVESHFDLADFQRELARIAEWITSEDERFARLMAPDEQPQVDAETAPPKLRDH